MNIRIIGLVLLMLLFTAFDVRAEGLVNKPGVPDQSYFEIIKCRNELENIKTEIKTLQRIR